MTIAITKNESVHFHLGRGTKCLGPLSIVTSSKKKRLHRTGVQCPLSMFVLFQRVLLQEVCFRFLDPLRPLLLEDLLSGVRTIFEVRLRDSLDSIEDSPDRMALHTISLRRNDPRLEGVDVLMGLQFDRRIRD